MTKPITEIAFIALKPDASLNEAGPTATAWHDILKSIREQDGFIRYAYGRQIENSDILTLYIDWEAQTTHGSFSDSQALSELSKEPIKSYHVSTTPASILDITSPIIQHSIFYNSEDEYIERIKKLLKVITEPAPNGLGEVVYGDVVEKLAGSDGVEGRTFVYWAGWDSLEAHAKARDEPALVQNRHLASRNPFNAEMFHVEIEKRS